MFIRSRARQQEQVRPPPSQEPQVPRSTPRRFAEREEQAALKIQSVWRGRRERAYSKKRRCRAKPWGFFTHTLALTYISSTRENPSVSTRRMVYLLMEDPGSSKAAMILAIVIVATILVSIGIFMLETEQAVYRECPYLWLALEVICTGVFTLEYCIRIAVCSEVGISPLRFIVTPLNLFDLMAVLPFYLELVLRSADLYNTVMLRMARLVRLIRLVRIFKLGRYSSGMRLMGEALINSTQAISVLIFLLCMGVVLFSSAIFHIERLSCPVREELSAEELREYTEDCNDSYNRGVSPRYGLCCTESTAGPAPYDFPSIIAALWWSMATMTSVGYGDIYPRTTLGKCVGFVAMLAGMVLIALPVAIVGQKFQDIYETRDLEEAKCRGASRLRADCKVWSLVPASDVVMQLRSEKLLDPALALSVANLAMCLEEVWEQREQLSRVQLIELEKKQAFVDKASRLLDGMSAPVHARSSPGAASQLEVP